MHARSVAAAAIDGVTGELVQAKLTPSYEHNPGSRTCRACNCEFTPLLRRLGCLRGIGTLTGFALAVEACDWDRFTGKPIGSFVGLVPSEYSSGASRVQDLDHQDRQYPLRRLLIEAAWHHRPVYRVEKTMRDRWKLVRPVAQARGDEGNRRRKQLEHHARPTQASRSVACRVQWRL